MLIPRCFTGHSSSSSRSREGRVNRGFRTDNGGKGEGEVRRFTGVRSRTVDTVVKEEGEDRRDRNERVRSDILGVRLGLRFKEVGIRVNFKRKKVKAVRASSRFKQIRIDQDRSE